MLQVAYIKQNIEEVKRKLAKKQFKNVALVDAVVAKDEERKRLSTRFDEAKAKINAASKEIGALMRSDKAAAESRKAEVEHLKTELVPIEQQLAEAEKELQQMLVQLPNLPSDLVPEGRTPADNEVVRTGGFKPQLHTGAVPHWELVKRHDLIDFELGNKITGSGFPVYKGKGAKLQRALIQYFLEYNTAAGYTEVIPPLMVNAASAYGTGQLPDKEGQMYHVTEDELYLIPTSEVPLTNIYRDVILKENELPVKMTAYTPCFRREAGSYGKDVRGLNRLHQFDKVEIVQLVAPERSYEVLEEMVAHVEGLVQSLGLHYRILRLCGGDMGFTSALTYDFEVYSAAQDKWLEVSSVSNFESYQTNRMKIRYKGGDGKPVLAHSLNGSSLALPRILACLLENNQKKDEIEIPQILKKYFHRTSIKVAENKKTITHRFIEEDLFFPNFCKSLLIGTFPSVLIKEKFGRLSEDDVPFYYGSSSNNFWRYFSDVYSFPLLYENSEYAVNQRKRLLEKLSMGITDIIRQCSTYGGVTDEDLLDNVLNTQVKDVIDRNPSIKTLYFTSKKAKDLTLKVLKKENRIAQRITGSSQLKFDIQYKDSEGIYRTMTLITLPSPSNRGRRGGNSFNKLSQYKSILPEL